MLRWQRSLCADARPTPLAPVKGACHRPSLAFAASTSPNTRSASAKAAARTNAGVVNPLRAAARPMARPSPSDTRTCTL